VNTAADAVVGTNAAPATITATAASPETLIAPPSVVIESPFSFGDGRRGKANATLSQQKAA
jgi:hypothetical protein